MAKAARTRSAAPSVSEIAGSRRRRQIDLGTSTWQIDPQMIAMKAYIDQKQLDDPFKDHYGGGTTSLSILEPPFSFYALMRLPNENSILKQCINAMVTNIDGHGHRFMYVGPEGGEESDEAKRELETLKNLFEYPNDDYSFQELRDRLRTDLESLGNSYMEVGRDARGRIVMLSHLPAHTMRMTMREVDPISVKVNLPRDGSPVSNVQKRFRRYVQQVGNRKVFFKEYGDPRPIDPATGEVNTALPLNQSATEVLYNGFYNPGSPYGIPRWFNQLPAIMGSREAELTNLEFFKDNAIPAMLLMVSGGLLTDDSLVAIEQHFRQVKGRQSMNRIAVIEVGGDPHAAPDNGTVPIPKVELKSMQGDRQGDSLFQNYESNNADKVRSSFRIPPIFLGLSSDYTYATAKTSFEIGEGQMFAPERARFDEMINAKVVRTYGVKNWKFRSLPPRIAAREDIIRAITAFERVGALTPNVAIGLANEFFDLEIKPVPEAWGDYPFSMINVMVQTSQLKPEAFSALADVMAELPDPDDLVAAGQPAAEDDEDQAAPPVDQDEREAVRDALIELRKRYFASAK
jgi:PBSX family phage portal protein